MIPNQWYPILESRDLKPGKPVGLTRLGQNLVLWRSATGTFEADRGVALLFSLRHRLLREATSRAADAA